MLEDRLVELQVVIQPLPQISIQETRWKERDGRVLMSELGTRNEEGGISYLPSPRVLLSFRNLPFQTFCSTHFPTVPFSVYL